MKEKNCESKGDCESRIFDLKEEMKALKETFSSKMSEMQKDLLSMVEHCLDFEKALSDVKEENKKLKSRINKMEKETQRREDEEKTCRNPTSRTTKSMDSHVLAPKTPNSIKQCKIVSVSSGSLGTSPSPSKSQSPDQHQEIKSSPNPRSTEMTEENAIWYPDASSAPFFTQDMNSQPAFDQPYPQFFPPGYYSYAPSGEVFFAPMVHPSE